MAHEVQQQLADPDYWVVSSPHLSADIELAERWSSCPRLDFDKHTVAEGLAQVRTLFADWQANDVMYIPLNRGLPVSRRVPIALTRMVVDRRWTLLGRSMKDIYAIEQGESNIPWEEFERRAPAMLAPSNTDPPITTRLHTSASAGRATLISRRIVLVSPFIGAGWEVSDVAGPQRHPEIEVMTLHRVGATVLRGFSAGREEVVDHIAAAHLVVPLHAPEPA